jgi:hypothetical protein
MGHGRVHWSANFDEIQDFEQDIRNAFGGTGFMSNTDYFAGTRSTSLGDPKSGISPDLDALAAYVSSLTSYPRSPARTNGTSSSAGLNGRQHFMALQCFTCHGGPDFTDSAYGDLHNVGTIKPSSGNRLGGPLTGIDTPTLRGIAGSAPYLHDGSAPDVASVFNSTNAPNGSPHAAFRNLSSTEQTELLSFLSELDGSEAAAPAASPRLSFATHASAVTLTWPMAATTFSLLSTTNLTPPVIWSPVTNTVQSTNNVFSLTVPNADQNRFFLLQGN